MFRMGKIDVPSVQIVRSLTADFAQELRINFDSRFEQERAETHCIPDQESSFSFELKGVVQEWTVTRNIRATPMFDMNLHCFTLLRRVQSKPARDLAKSHARFSNISARKHIKH
jgi:hypothetical protein